MLQQKDKSHMPADDKNSSSSKIVQLNIEHQVLDNERTESSSSKPSSSTSGEEQHYSLVRDREKHTIKPPSRFEYEDLASFALFISSGDLSSFQEAMLNEEKDRWMGAIVEEIESLHKNQT